MHDFGKEVDDLLPLLDDLRGDVYDWGCHEGYPQMQSYPLLSLRPNS